VTAVIELLPLQPVIDRLKTAAPSLRDVGGVADMAATASKGAVIATPTAMVIPLGANPYDPEEGSGPLRQTIDVTFGVVLGVTLAGALGAKGLQQAEGPANEIRAALFGWQHPGAVRKCWMGGESVEDFNAQTGVLLYRLDFTTRVRIQES
jgi:hypothetical protein